MNATAERAQSRPHTRDHVQELWMGVGPPRPPTSSYRANHSNTREIKEELAVHDHTHHKRRDWLKDYFELVNQNKKVAR